MGFPPFSTLTQHTGKEININFFKQLKNNNDSDFFDPFRVLSLMVTLRNQQKNQRLK